QTGRRVDRQADAKSSNNPVTGQRSGDARTAGRRSSQARCARPGFLAQERCPCIGEGSEYGSVACAHLPTKFQHGGHRHYKLVAAFDLQCQWAAGFRITLHARVERVKVDVRLQIQGFGQRKLTCRTEPGSYTVNIRTAADTVVISGDRKIAMHPVRTISTRQGTRQQPGTALAL